MIHGASIRISPSWITDIVTLDISWDDDTLTLEGDSRGPWWGPLALLAGTGSNQGEWIWDAPLQLLELWAGGGRIAILSPFSFPITTGMGGDGSLEPNLAPTKEPPAFTWEAFYSGL